MNDPMKLFLTAKTWAVVGVSQSPRYALRIYRTLKAHKKTVWAVNPTVTTVDGDRVFAHVSDLPQTPEVLVMVVNPTIGTGILKEAKEKGIQTIWLQPGTTSDSFLATLNQLKLTPVEACVLVVASLYDQADNKSAN